jgi:hypothetical protein
VPPPYEGDSIVFAGGNSFPTNVYSGLWTGSGVAYSGVYTFVVDVRGVTDNGAGTPSLTLRVAGGPAVLAIPDDAMPGLYSVGYTGTWNSITLIVANPPTDSKWLVHGVAAYEGNGQALVAVQKLALGTNAAISDWSQLGAQAESDPVWQAEKASYATGSPVYVESDPSWAAASNKYVAKAGDTMTANLDMGTSNRIVDVANPVNDGDAVNKAFLRSVLLYLPPQGDLSMGVYTNGAVSSPPLTF